MYNHNMVMRLLFCLTFLKLTASESQIYNLTIDYYTKLIEEQTENLKFPPQNGYEFMPNTGKVTDYGRFDYIIVGAGSTGAVLATRLSEDPKLKILLIEAGEPQSPFTDIPGMMILSQGTKANWNFKTVPQTTCCLGMVDHECPYPRGKVLGGSSVLNALMYVRGNKEDYNLWKRQGNPGWAYKDVLPYFIKSENSQINGDHGFHGKGGLLNVEYHRPNSPQLNTFLSGLNEFGLPTLDYNGKDQFGASPTQLNTLRGTRDSTSKAFLTQAERRPNLKILTGHLVTKVLFNKHKQAYGVAFTNRTGTFIANATKEIILSAGAFGSPQLLMLSGIGPAAHLQEHNIPVIQDLAVGNNLQDHITFYGLLFSSNYTEPTKTTRQLVDDYLKDYGPYTVPGSSEGLAFFNTQNNGAKVPDVEFIIITSNSSSPILKESFRLTDETYNAVWGKSNPANVFSFYLMLLHPKSRGTVRLQSSNPYDYPLIDPKFLSDPEGDDIERIYKGIQIALRLLNTTAFKEMDVKLFDATLPACSNFTYLSKDYWYCQIRQLTYHIHHPASTCKMGPSPKQGAVVNSQLRVHGVSKLRVADASVLPELTSGHLNAPCIMIGEKLADMLKKKRSTDSC